MANYKEKNKNKKQIVIIGGGFAGLTAAKVLLKAKWQVSLINNDKYFLFVPLLHEVATNHLKISDIRFAYSSFFKNSNFKLIPHKVEKINLKTREIIVDKQNIGFNYLLIATGSKTNQERVAGADQVLVLNNEKQAKIIKNKIEKLFSKEKIVINIIGAGPTGIELVLELSNWLATKHSNYLINLFHPRQNLLLWLHKKIGSLVAKNLFDKKINLYTNQRVQKIKHNKVITKTGEYDGDLVVLTSGVTGNSQIVDSEWCNDNAEIIVNDFLQVKNQDTIFAAGDIIAQEDKRLPNLAQIAVDQGRLAAKNIIKHQASKKMKKYKVKIKGIFIALGNHRALGQINGWVISGYWVWWLWRVIYLLNVPGFYNKISLSKAILRQKFSKH